MEQALTMNGFRELSRDELVQTNGGGWGFWKVIGMAIAGWCKLFAGAALIAEIYVGDYEDAWITYDYYWGYNELAEE